MNNPIKISAVIITYNEEKNIERCLQSLLGVVDEIVVVDSFSTDNTKTICLSYNVKFVEHKFISHIEQKNWAITQASNFYVLSLDADEALSDELKKSILNVKNNCTASGYYFNRCTNYCGKWIKHGSFYPDRKLRLFDSRKGAWQGINPHDEYKLTTGETAKFIKGDLLHYSYYSIEQHIEQVNYFTTIATYELFNKGKHISLIQLVIYSKWRFFRDYIIKLGFIDGYYGFVIAAISAFASFLKYIKLYQLYKKRLT